MVVAVVVAGGRGGVPMVAVVGGYVLLQRGSPL